MLLPVFAFEIRELTSDAEIASQISVVSEHARHLFIKTLFIFRS